MMKKKSINSTKLLRENLIGPKQKIVYKTIKKKSINSTKLLRINLIDPQKKIIYKTIKKKELRVPISRRFFSREFVPRKWWYPILEFKINKNENERQRQHEECSRTVRRAIFGLTAFSLFCILALSASDIALLTTNAKIKVPFANVEVAFRNFIVFAPIMLMGLLIYLHIFFGHLRLIDEPDVDSQLPVIFNFQYRSARILSAFLLYWQAPIVLVVFYWKSIPQPNSVLLFFIMLITIFYLIFMQIRRCPGERRKKQNPFLWFILLYISIVFVDKVIVLVQGKSVSDSFLGKQNTVLNIIFGLPFQRRLQLEGANLSDADLNGFNLSYANMRNVNMKGAKLSGANMDYTDLSGANLISIKAQYARFYGANFSDAIMNEANLEESVLSEANLRNASLRKANLRYAILQGADLSDTIMIKADLRNADFTRAIFMNVNLTGSKIDGAFIQNEKLKDFLSPNSITPNKESKKSDGGS